MKSGVIVRIFDKDAKRETITLSDELASAIVPLRAGSYCFSTFDDKGRRLHLDRKQARCFVIQAGKVKEVGVVGNEEVVTSTTVARQSDLTGKIGFLRVTTTQLSYKHGAPESSASKRYADNGSAR